MGEHGNYTNATAGYVGSNKSAGIESHWKYMRRDTVGGAGSTRRISLNVFIPSLIQYLRDLSRRHASKILCPKTGAHRFPSVPSITTSLWGKVQEFRVIRLLLSVCDGSAASAKQWQNELSFFNDLPTGEVYTDMINKYREAKRPRVARSSLAAIIMPSERLMKKKWKSKDLRISSKWKLLSRLSVLNTYSCSMTQRNSRSTIPVWPRMTYSM
jgi:hypothetical protein